MTSRVNISLVDNRNRSVRKVASVAVGDVDALLAAVRNKLRFKAGEFYTPSGLHLTAPDVFRIAGDIIVCRKVRGVCACRV
jgi:hypothetical protein